MRSRNGFYGALALLLGAPFALASSIAFDAGASEIIHIALGVSFLLLAAAVFDFTPGRSVIWVAAAAIGVLGAIFLLQGVADIARSDALRSFTYDALGQRLEKLLGYAFLVWVGAIAINANRGAMRWAGIAVVAFAVAVEAYGQAMRFSGALPSEALKLLTLPVFVWIAAASWRQRAVSS